MSKPTDVQAAIARAAELVHFKLCAAQNLPWEEGDICDECKHLAQDEIAPLFVLPAPQPSEPPNESKSSIPMSGACIIGMHKNCSAEGCQCQCHPAPAESTGTPAPCPLPANWRAYDKGYRRDVVFALRTCADELDQWLATRAQPKENK
jgi:hypothetical protein